MQGDIISKIVPENNEMIRQSFEILKTEEKTELVDILKKLGGHIYEKNN